MFCQRYKEILLVIANVMYIFHKHKNRKRPKYLNLQRRCMRLSATGQVSFLQPYLEAKALPAEPDLTRMASHGLALVQQEALGRVCTGIWESEFWSKCFPC